MQMFRTYAWLFCGIYATIPAYWMMVHPFAARWRTARYKLKLLAPLWMLMWCAAWAVSYPWRNAVLYHSRGTWAAALLPWTVSIFMYVNATRELSVMRVIGRDELEPEKRPKKLVTLGVHRLVRHPMYLGHFCTMLGFVLSAGTVACFGLFVFGVCGGAVMVRYEERELHARFGPEWEEYCKQTAAIFPLLK